MTKSEQFTESPGFTGCSAAPNSENGRTSTASDANNTIDCLDRRAKP